MRIMIWMLAVLLTASPLIAANMPATGSGVYEVRAFGAHGDGVTIDSPAINAAIEAASAAGGGRVEFSPGTYASYSIHLKSNVSLYFEQGATLLALSPTATAGYDAPEPNAWDKYQDFGHSHWHNSLIWGENLENISILGPGLLNGSGLSRDAPPRPGPGNKTISLKLCRNVIIRDVSILRGGHFGILATGVDNLTIDNLKIDTNRDGMDLDCCRNVRVSDCSVNSPSDDGICPKSSFALGYARATEDVTITNCQVTGYDVGTFLDGSYKLSRSRASSGARRGDGPTGRIKFGTESNGGFKNITISNCIFDHCCGLAIESVDGGDIEDIGINNITMRDIGNAPIFIRLGNRARGPNHPVVGVIRRVNISNVVVSSASPRYGCVISGIPDHPIEDVSISNVRILYEGGGSAEDAARTPPEKETAYPEPSMFGDMPSYGFFLRHVRGIELRDINIGWEKPDMRPAFALNDVTDADFEQIKAERAPGTPAFSLHKVSGFNAAGVRGMPDTKRDLVEDEKF